MMLMPADQLAVCNEIEARLVERIEAQAESISLELGASRTSRGADVEAIAADTVMPERLAGEDFRRATQAAADALYDKIAAYQDGRGHLVWVEKPRFLTWPTVETKLAFEAAR